MYRVVIVMRFHTTLIEDQPSRLTATKKRYPEESNIDAIQKKPTILIVTYKGLKQRQQKTILPRWATDSRKLKIKYVVTEGRNVPDLGFRPAGEAAGIW